MQMYLYMQSYLCLWNNFIILTAQLRKADVHVFQYLTSVICLKMRFKIEDTSQRPHHSFHFCSNGICDFTLEKNININSGLGELHLPPPPNESNLRPLSHLYDILAMILRAIIDRIAL